MGGMKGAASRQTAKAPTPRKRVWEAEDVEQTLADVPTDRKVLAGMFEQFIERTEGGTNFGQELPPDRYQLCGLVVRSVFLDLDKFIRHRESNINEALAFRPSDEVIRRQSVRAQQLHLLAVRFEKLKKTIRLYIESKILGDDESKAPDYNQRKDVIEQWLGICYDDVPSPQAARAPRLEMGDAEHDLNALAARLDYSFEQAAALIMEAAKSRDDPLRHARRVVNSFDRRRAKNRNLREPVEVKSARSVANRANYQNRKAKNPGL